MSGKDDPRRTKEYAQGFEAGRAYERRGPMPAELSEPGTWVTPCPDPAAHGSNQPPAVRIAAKDDLEYSIGWNRLMRFVHRLIAAYEAHRAG